MVKLMKMSVTDDKVLVFAIETDSGWTYGCRLRNGKMEPPSARFGKTWRKQAHFKRDVAEAVYTAMSSALSDKTDPFDLGKDRKKISLDSDIDAGIEFLLPEENHIERLYKKGLVKGGEAKGKTPAAPGPQLPTEPVREDYVPPVGYMLQMVDEDRDGELFEVIPKHRPVLDAEAARGKPYRPGNSGLIDYTLYGGAPFNKDNAEYWERTN